MVGDEIPWARHIWVTGARDRRRLRAGRRRRACVLGVAIAWSPAMSRRADAVPRVRQHAAQGRDRAAVPDLDGLRHPAQHADRRADRLLPGGDQHRGRPDARSSQDLLDLGRVFNAPKWKVFAQDPHAQRLPLHPERAEGHRDGRGGRRDRRRVRRLAARARLRHRHHAEQHEHAGRVRGAGLDLDRSGWCCYGVVVRAVAAAGAVGRGIV